MRELIADRMCFVCGPDNPHGLHATFEATQDCKATGRFDPREHHQGYAGVLHGGIIAGLLDEAMFHAASPLGFWAATAELTVKYHKPSPLDEPLVISAEVTSHRKRLLECRAELRRDDGTLVASASAKLLQGNPISASDAALLRRV